MVSIERIGEHKHDGMTYEDVFAAIQQRLEKWQANHTTYRVVSIMSAPKEFMDYVEIWVIYRND